MDNKSVIEKFNEKCAPFYLVDHDNGTFSLCYPFSFVDEKYRFYGQEAFDKYAERIGEPARDERGFCTHGNGYEWAIVFNKYFENDRYFARLHTDCEAGGFFCYCDDRNLMVEVGLRFKNLIDDTYTFTKTVYFNDEDYFLLPCIESFEKIPRRADWLFSHFAELLRRFAENGNKRAERALIQKYDYLLSVLLNKRRFISYDFERDNFERICITLSSLGGIDILLKIAADMGMLFRKNPHYSGSDFDWFCSSMDDGIGEKRLHILLKREAKKSGNIACFYDNYLKAIEETKNIVRSPIEIPCAEDIKNEVDITGALKPSLRVRFSRRANEDEKLKLAQAVVAEQNPDKKAEMLSTFAFFDESFPLSHEIIIEYSKSSHEKLREISFEVLTGCQSHEVREYALKLLATGKYKAQAIQMLLCNYTSADKALLLSELGKIKVNYNNESDWHSVGSKILNVCDQGIKLSKEFFVYIYETTLCSCCREYAVRALAKHRWLTRDIIEECRYDSNYDISEYINRYYPINN